MASEQRLVEKHGLRVNSRRRFVLAASALWVIARRAQAKDLERAWTNLRSGVVVQGADYKGVIFDASDAKLVRGFVGRDVEDFWTPTGPYVSLFENHLGEALEAGMKSPNVLSPTRQEQWYLQRVLPEHLGRILKGLSGYGRQYFGIVGKTKRKRLFVNLFVLPPDHNDSWTRGYVSVDDGGIAFWRIQFDIASKRFIRFNTNGFG